MNKELKPIIGLEIHIELNTQSKMFCDCSAVWFGKKPNTLVCPVCLGLPGSLPVPNQKAIDWTIILGLALNCQINKESFFERKHYFYPDLPKGFQISQYQKPFCFNGFYQVGNQRIAIARVHLEEDTGKLIHKKDGGKEWTLIDFNRSGVPLVEIVTAPEIKNAAVAKDFLKEIRLIVRALKISDADMEKGSMRLEANISLSKNLNSPLPNYKVEIKNINSFRFLTRAINYEIERQINILNRGQTVRQETRGFDEKTGKTYSQRTKEEAKDYRYFPEPDIPPIVITDEQINNIRKQLPELPSQKIKRYINNLKIKPNDAKILARELKTAIYFETAVKLTRIGQIKPQRIANDIVNKKVNINKIAPKQYISYLIKQKPESVDKKELKKIIEQVLKKNQKAAGDYKKGKTEVVGFLIGETRRQLKEIKAKQVQEIIIELLKTKS